jgi:hypothetical protein
MNSDVAIDTVNKLKKAHCFTSVFEYLNESLTEAVDKDATLYMIYLDSTISGGYAGQL